MKAKQYAKDFIEKFEGCYDDFPVKEIKKETGDLGIKFLTEFQDMCKARNINAGSKETSLINLVKEFSKKWKSMALIINTFINNKFEYTVFRYDGFVELFKASEPDFIYLLEKYNIN